MSKLSLADLKKVIYNHNKILKKEKIKATGKEDVLLQRVKEVYKMKENKTDTVFTHKKRKDITYTLNKTGTKERETEDSKFKSMTAAKKAKSAASKKKRDAKKAKMLSDERIKTIKALNTLKKLKGRKTKPKATKKVAEKVVKEKPKSMKVKVKVNMIEPKKKTITIKKKKKAKKFVSKLKPPTKPAGKVIGVSGSPPKSIDRKDKKAMGAWYKKASAWSKYRESFSKYKTAVQKEKRANK